LDLLSERLAKIAILENIKINKECVEHISEISGGDGRKAIMILQNCKYITKEKNDCITIEDCDEITGITNNKILKNIYDKLLKSNIYELNDFVIDIINNGTNLNNLLKYIKDNIIVSKISDSNKSKIITEILNIECKLMEKADESLQILYLFSMISLIMMNKI